MRNLTLALFIGGHPLHEDESRANTHPHIAVGAPGRMLSLINAGHLRCESVQIVCLDEADELLKESFVDQIKGIFEYLSGDVQCLLFSATIPIEAFSVKILVRAEELTLDGISQFFLLDIFGELLIQKSVIFANQKEAVEHVKNRMTESNFAVTAIHSDLSQIDRDAVMKDFRVGRTRVLIARGIDVQQVTIVINFERPKNKELYLHRIGRSARWGRKGVAINICDAKEMRIIDDLSRYCATHIEQMPQDIQRIVHEVNEDHARKEKPTV